MVSDNHNLSIEYVKKFTAQLILVVEIKGNYTL